MNHKSATIFIITACLLVTANADQGLMDCRKLVYSRNCRGVAVKRGDLENDQTRSENLQHGFSLKQLIYGLGSTNGRSLTEDMKTDPSVDRFEDKGKNVLQKDNQRLDSLLFELFSGKNRENNENYYLPFYEY